MNLAITDAAANTKIRGVIICADDYGISPGVDEAIVDLAERRMLSAASCMTVWPEWKTSADKIRPLLQTIDVGLHFTLTGQGFQSYPELFRATTLGKIDEGLVTRELDTQWDRFTSELGVRPTFLDGHHHVHQLPVINRVIRRFLGAQPMPIYTRNTAIGLGAVLQRRVAIGKNLALSASGARWKSLAKKAGIQTNDGFTGAYQLSGQSGPRDEGKVEQLFCHFAKCLSGSRPIWMVHPGNPDTTLTARDSFVQGRELEYQALKSRRLGDVLRSHSVQIQRFSDFGTHKSA